MMTSSSPRVFFAHNLVRVDTSTAKKFGTTVTLIDWNISPFQDDILQIYLKVLRDYKFDPKTDFLLCVGQVTIVAVMFAAATTLARQSGADSVRVLSYDSRQLGYREKKIQVILD